jgi:hypothetical protein
VEGSGVVLRTAFEAAAIIEAVKGTRRKIYWSLPVAFMADGQRKQNSSLGSAIEETISRLKTAGLAKSEDTIVARSFGGVYFSFEQAVVLDAALSVAQRASGKLQDTLKAVALSTASTLVNTVGKQCAQPIQPRSKSGVVKPGLANSVHKDVSLDSLGTYRGWSENILSCLIRGNHQAIRADYLVYDNMVYCSVFTPPATLATTTVVLPCLETMCLRDNPTTSLVEERASSLAEGPKRQTPIPLTVQQHRGAESFLVTHVNSICRWYFRTHLTKRAMVLIHGWSQCNRLSS